MFVRLSRLSLVPLTLLALLAALLPGCGIAGDRGLAIFHIGENWQKGVPIAVGSTFAVTAEKNDLLRTPLLTSSGLPSVVKMPDGSFQAVQPGLAQFQAQEVVNKTLVDTVEFTTATPVTVSLGAWWQGVKLPKKFALVRNGRYVGGLVLEDATGTRLNHAGLVHVTCDHAQINVVGQYVEATPTVLGDTTATVTVTGTTLETKYTLSVVEATAVAALQLASVAVQTGQSAPADPDKAPVHPDSGGTGATTTAAKSQLFLLTTATTLADGTPVYGARVSWSETSAGHVLAKETDGSNYAVLKSGDTVTVTATVGTLSQQVVLTAP